MAIYVEPGETKLTYMKKTVTLLTLVISLSISQATESIVGSATKTFDTPEIIGQRVPESDGNTLPDVHDPVLAYENGKYYMFTTGFGIGWKISRIRSAGNCKKCPLKKRSFQRTLCVC